jgi:hypothetical protein
MEVEEDIDIIEESFIAINKRSIKQEEIPEDISFPDIKCEPEEVSYVCVCLLLDRLKSGFGFFGGGGSGSVNTSLVGVRVIVEEMKRYSYIH